MFKNLLLLSSIGIIFLAPTAQANDIAKQSEVVQAEMQKLNGMMVEKYQKNNNPSSNTVISSCEHIALNISCDQALKRIKYLKGWGAHIPPNSGYRGTNTGIAIGSRPRL